MSNTKQTAVDFLIEYFDAVLGVYIPNEKIPQNIIKQAKEMEEHQHKLTWNAGADSEAGNTILTFEKYYQLTYGGNNEQ